MSATMIYLAICERHNDHLICRREAQAELESARASGFLDAVREILGEVQCGHMIIAGDLHEMERLGVDFGLCGGLLLPNGLAAFRATHTSERRP